MTKILEIKEKVTRFAVEHPSSRCVKETTLFVSLQPVTFWFEPNFPIKNRDERMLRRMKNNTISSGELVIAVNHDNPNIKKLVLHYIKHPQRIVWNI